MPEDKPFTLGPESAIEDAPAFCRICGMRLKDGKCNQVHPAHIVPGDKAPTVDELMAASKADPIKYGEFEVKDSGERRQFVTGAQRDMGAAKGLFHLIPFYPMERLGQLYEAGAKKYGRNNWRKGIPCSVFADSAMRHLMKLNDGWTDEDHGAAVLWNMCGYLWTEDRCKRGLLPKELLDMPHHENEKAE